MSGGDTRQRAWRNRRLIAERTGWPDGAVEVCEQVEMEHPGWSPHWRPANAHFGTPAGYYATRMTVGRRRDEPPAYGTSAEGLTRAIKDASSACAVCGEIMEYPRGSASPWHQPAGAYGVEPCAGWGRLTV